MQEFKASLIPLQWMIFVVLVFNFAEALVCFANFYTANLSGEYFNAAHPSHTRSC
jgi:hypothetical protein